MTKTITSFLYKIIKLFPTFRVFFGFSNVQRFNVHRGSGIISFQTVYSFWNGEDIDMICTVYNESRGCLEKSSFPDPLRDAKRKDNRRYKAQFYDFASLFRSSSHRIRKQRLSSPICGICLRAYKHFPW